MEGLVRTPPPRRVKGWDGHPQVLAGAILHCGFRLGAHYKGSKDNELIPFAHQKLDRNTAKAVLNALSDPRLLQLAVTLLKLAGPLLAFNKSLLVESFTLICRARKAVERTRDIVGWTMGESLKVLTFCSGVRRLLRDERAPTTLTGQLGYDAAELAQIASELKAT